MVRYNNKNMGDPLYEFEQDYQIVEVDAQHVPISGTEKATRIIPTKGVAQDPTKAPISGANIQEMELALQDLNKIDANHNITLIPANVYYTDTELINYMTTNGYKDISVANTVYFEPSVANGNLRIIVGDNNKYTFLYYDLGDKMYKKSDTVTTNQYLSTTLLTIANKSYIDEKDDEIKASVAVTNERLDSVVENVGAILESSSVPTIQNIAYPTVDTKLPIKTAVYTKVSNSTKLSFDETLNYTFNLHELGTYNINLKFIIASTANRIVTIKLFKYVDGITDFLTYTWPNVTITNNQTLNVSALPFPLVKGLAGTDKYYITYAADGAGVTGQGYDLVVDLVVDQNTIPPSIGTNSVYSQGVTGHPDNTTSTVIFNDLKGRTQNQTADGNGTTFSNGIAFPKVQAPLAGDISNHISVYDNTNGIGFSGNAMTYVSQFSTHKFTNPSSNVYAVVKDIIDEPKSLTTKEYVDNRVKRYSYRVPFRFNRTEGTTGIHIHCNKPMDLKTTKVEFDVISEANTAVAEGHNVAQLFFNNKSTSLQSYDRGTYWLFGGTSSSAAPIWKESTYEFDKPQMILGHSGNNSGANGQSHTRAEVRLNNTDAFGGTLGGTIFYQAKTQMMPGSAPTSVILEHTAYGRGTMPLGVGATTTHELVDVYMGFWGASSEAIMGDMIVTSDDPGLEFTVTQDIAEMAFADVEIMQPDVDNEVELPIS